MYYFKNKKKQKQKQKKGLKFDNLSYLEPCERNLKIFKQ